MTTSFLDKITTATAAAVDQVSTATGAETTSTPTPTPSQPVTVTETTPASTPQDPDTNELDQLGLDEDEFQFEFEKGEGDKLGDKDKPVSDPAEDSEKPVDAPPVKEGEDNWPTVNGKKLSPKEIENAFLTTERGRRQLAHWKGMRDLSLPPSEDGTGGIGFTPTPQQVKEFYSAYNSFAQLTDDWESGKPEQMGQVVQALFSVGEDGKPTETAVRGIEALTSSLPPELYGTLAKSVVTEFVKDLVNRAGDTSLPETDRTYFRNLATAIEEDVFGEQKHSIDPAKAAADPLRHERERLANQERQLQERTQSEAKRKETIVKNHVDAGKKTLQSQLLNEALSSFLPAYSDDKIAKNGVTSLFNEAVKTRMTANVASRREYNSALNQAIKTGTQADANRAITIYKNWLAQSIRPVLSEFRSEASRRKVAQSTATHSAAQSSVAASANPSGQGGPAGMSTVPARKPGESKTDYYQRLAQNVNI
jgi:hypothetical protein